MTQTILVCRMGSSRLPGKTLKAFGERSLLAHIVHRIALAGIPAGDVVVCTSELPEDRAIVDAAAALGARAFAGSPDDVSRRIRDAARAVDAEGFLLLLGDNPWLDPCEMRAAAAAGASGRDYVVTATRELPEPWPERVYPIGTRVQYVKRALLEARIDELDSAETREHVSKLFADLPAEMSSEILVPVDGWSAAELGALNVSVNTREDYDRALRALVRCGPDAPAREIAIAYREDGA